jgi:hypothetical protein
MAFNAFNHQGFNNPSNSDDMVCFSARGRGLLLVQLATRGVVHGAVDVLTNQFGADQLWKSTFRSWFALVCVRMPS